MISSLYYQHIPIGTGRYLRRYIRTLTNKINIRYIDSIPSTPTSAALGTNYMYSLQLHNLIYLPTCTYTCTCTLYLLQPSQPQSQVHLHPRPRPSKKRNSLFNFFGGKSAKRAERGNFVCCAVCKLSCLATIFGKVCTYLLQSTKKKGEKEILPSFLD